eukprot:2855658-Rhodomonas_salina.1
MTTELRNLEQEVQAGSKKRRDKYDRVLKHRKGQVLPRPRFSCDTESMIRSLPSESEIWCDGHALHCVVRNSRMSCVGSPGKLGLRQVHRSAEFLWEASVPGARQEDGAGGVHTEEQPGTVGAWKVGERTIRGRAILLDTLHGALNNVCLRIRRIRVPESADYDVRDRARCDGSCRQVLALSGASGSPFLAMDEFDVFMDETNRTVGLRMLVD